MIETVKIQTNQNYPRETIYYKKGRSSSEILKSGYLGLYNYYKNPKVILSNIFEKIPEIKRDEQKIARTGAVFICFIV